MVPAYHAVHELTSTTRHGGGERLGEAPRFREVQRLSEQVFPGNAMAQVDNLQRPCSFEPRE